MSRTSTAESWGYTIQPIIPHYLCGFQQASDFHVSLITNIPQMGTNIHEKGSSEMAGFSVGEKSVL